MSILAGVGIFYFKDDLFGTGSGSGSDSGATTAPSTAGVPTAVTAHGKTLCIAKPTNYNGTGLENETIFRKQPGEMLPNSTTECLMTINGKTLSPVPGEIFRPTGPYKWAKKGFTGDKIIKIGTDVKSKNPLYVCKAKGRIGKLRAGEDLCFYPDGNFGEAQESRTNGTVELAVYL